MSSVEHANGELRIASPPVVPMRLPLAISVTDPPVTRQVRQPSGVVVVLQAEHSQAVYTRSSRCASGGRPAAYVWLVK